MEFVENLSFKFGEFARCRFLRLIFSTALVGLVAACAVPQHMQVRSGIDPRNQDDHVRFRATYYFRTFDACFELVVPAPDRDRRHGHRNVRHLRRMDRRFTGWATRDMAFAAAGG